jgi:hypothetical protein
MPFGEGWNPSESAYFPLYSLSTVPDLPIGIGRKPVQNITGIGAD